MGNKQHKGTVLSPGTGGGQVQHAQAAAPYLGSPCQYYLLEMSVGFHHNIAFHFAPGHNMISTNIDSYYPALAQPYQQGWRMTSFYRIPGVAQQRGLFTTATDVPFQGIFVRLSNDPEFHREQYQLKVEKSIMFVSMFRSGILSLGGYQGVHTEMADIHMKIAQNTQNGGRLVCIEPSGQYMSQGLGAALRGAPTGMGVDAFFNMPLHPNPRHYVYQAVNVPIVASVTLSFSNSIQVQCDWGGHLTAQLQQGWRLVDIFLDSTYMHSRTVRTTHTMNSVWFFEKPADAMNDPTPVYEGTIMEFDHKIHASIGGTYGEAGWNPLLQDMGAKGWELACILDTPEVRLSGFNERSMLMLLFFQRKIVRQAPAPGAPSPPPPGFVAPTAPGGSQPDKH